MTRKDRLGSPAGGFLPDEALTLHQALTHYTSGSACGSYDEHRLGMIREGYLADFILLDADPFTLTPDDWLSLTVSATYVGGDMKYENQNRDR